MKLILLSLLVGSLGASPSSIRRGALKLSQEGPENLVPYGIKDDGYPEIDSSYLNTAGRQRPVLICDQNAKPVTEQSSTHNAGSVAGPKKTEVQKSTDGQGSTSSRK